MRTIHINYCNHVYKHINAFEYTCMNNIHTYTHIHIHIINPQVHTYTLHVYYGAYIRPATNMQGVICVYIITTIQLSTN